MSLGKIIAVTNQKGGVGKTTTSVNLAAALVATKKKVLLIDLDPQGNATSGAGNDKDDCEASVYDVLMRPAAITEAIVPANSGGFDLLPANGDLTAAEVELLNEIGRELRLKQALKTIQDRYDYILIDCPPSLNMLTLNALVAADSVLIPIQCEYYALEGLTALMETVEKVRGVLNPQLEIGGLLRTMFDPRNSLSNDVSGQLLAHFGEKVFRTIIPRNVRLAEAPSHGQNVIEYDRQSRGAVAYLTLASEVLRRNQAVAETA